MYIGGLMTQTPRARSSNAASVAQYAPEHRPMNSELETSSGLNSLVTVRMSSSQYSKKNSFSDARGGHGLSPKPRMSKRTLRIPYPAQRRDKSTQSRDGPVCSSMAALNMTISGP